MALLLDQVLERVQKPINREILDIAVRHEDRVKFCVKKCLAYNQPAYTYQHIERIKALLPAPKFNKYISELTFPLPIMETADVIFSGLSKIFDGQNKAVYPSLNDSDLQNEFVDYLEYMGFNQFWESRAWEAYRSEHNCILTIDLPDTQISSRPQPYINIIDISSVKDIAYDKDGYITELIYVNERNYIVGIDEINYHLFEPIDDDKLQWRYLSSGFHGLGYCPAKFLVDDALDAQQPLVKESPVSKVLYAMEKLQFRIISGENLEDYAAYPIAVIAETECEYQDADGNRCQAGYINFTNGAGIGVQVPCPVCADNHLVGAGSAYISRKNKDDITDLNNTIKWVTPDIDGLNYKDQSIDRRTQSIIASCIGLDQSALIGQAKNEKQIVSQVESSQTILNRVKRNFERSIKFSLDTMGKLMYEGAYLGSTVNLGTRFFLLTPDQIQARLDGAIESGAPEYEIGLIRDEMNATEYQNDPRMIQRLKVLKRLEPYPNLKTSDIDNLISQNKISDDDLFLKYNFTIFIAQFEDENGDVVDFGTLLSFSEKIKRIKTKLYDYVREQRPQTSTGTQTG